MEDWKWVASELFLLSLSVVVETKSQPNRWQSKADKNGTSVPIGKKSSLDDCFHRAQSFEMVDNWLGRKIANHDRNQRKENRKEKNRNINVALV